MKLYEALGLNVRCGDCIEPGKFVAGVECELEGVRTPQDYGIFKVTKDGSLRGHGFEFISAPATKDKLVEEFTKLHDWLVFYDKEDPFSVRTSTHVHVNCMNLEENEIRNIILLYALFEEFFFVYVKPIRRDNIHCVPLAETHLSNFYNRPLQGMMERWSKYTALNLGRLGDLGTIEFRHLEGTGDSAHFETWLTILNNLWNLGQRVTLDAASLNDKELVTQWFDTIFAPAPAITQFRPVLFDVIHNGMIDVKFSTVH